MILAIFVIAAVAGSRPASADPGTLATYLYGNAHTDYDGAETQLNSSTASTLTQTWATSGYWTTTQPVVADGHIFWPDWHGVLHATNTATHRDDWAYNVGTTTSDCTGLQGPDSTPTIATVGGRDTVFIGTPTGHLVAIDEVTGQLLWDNPLDGDPAADIWSSPALYDGSLFIGVASVGDCPLVQGQLFKVDASTGALQATFDAVPDGCTGAGIWSTPTIDEATGDVYVSTGNGDGACPEPYQEAIVELASSDLSVLDHWQTPDNAGDNDFGATPTLFQGSVDGAPTPMVGAMNKNGTFYALARNDLHAGPVWTRFFAIPDEVTSEYSAFLAPAAYDGKHLYIGGDTGVINGLSCAGSLSALNPSTGAPAWQDCLTGRVLGAVLAAPGIVEVGEGSTFLVTDSSNGNTLFSYTEPSGNLFWSPGYISHGTLYVTNNDGYLRAFTVSPAAIVPESGLPILLPCLFVLMVGAWRLRRIRRAPSQTSL